MLEQSTLASCGSVLVQQSPYFSCNKEHHGGVQIWYHHTESLLYLILSHSEIKSMKRHLMFDPRY